MCTVSVIPTNDDGFRLVTNRDERRDRPPAEPPDCHELAPGRAALWPTDPQSRGTWVAATDRALVLAILNLNLDPPPPTPEEPRSRGSIIPTIIEAIDAARAAACLRDIDLSHYAPFRLLAADPRRIVIARWDRAELTIESGPLAPTCLVSSGLGDHLVQEPRLALWDESVIKAGYSIRTQDAFHAHTWPDRPHLSVMMSREDARTVSRTSVHVHPDTIEMTYDDASAPPAVLHIPRIGEAPAPSVEFSA